jgi:hypothetical protein
MRSVIRCPDATADAVHSEGTPLEVLLALSEI